MDQEELTPEQRELLHGAQSIHSNPQEGLMDAASRTYRKHSRKIRKELEYQNTVWEQKQRARQEKLKDASWLVRLWYKLVD